MWRVLPRSALVSKTCYATISLRLFLFHFRRHIFIVVTHHRVCLNDDQSKAGKIWHNWFLC